MDKATFLRNIKDELILGQSFTLADVDEHKPWGAYYRLDDRHADEFIKKYFPGRSVEELGKGGSLSPKFLIFEPGKKLSFQYHHRRAEIWHVISGQLMATITDQDHEADYKIYDEGDELSYGAEARHRAGAPEGNEWCVVAEIWQHTDSENPTDESDIVRLKDDFGRS